jgi:hypothetical protein
MHNPYKRKKKKKKKKEKKKKEKNCSCKEVEEKPSQNEIIDLQKSKNVMSKSTRPFTSCTVQCVL